MLFNSWQFLLFFPTVVLLHFLVPHRSRWALLLCASYFFYMCWKPAYALLIVGSTLVDYVVALAMARTAHHGKRRALLVVSLLTNLGLLFSFKYLNFLNDSLAHLYSAFALPFEASRLDVLLPVGISFYTFQTLSYTIEVYRERQAPERHFGFFALYVSYFPQLVAGPIERPQNLLPQLRAKQDFDYDRVTSGLRLMAWGLFKKVVIADRLAVLVDRVYDAPEQFGGIGIVTATIFFAFQIYCDFSGYSDIAIGAAEVMGHRLMHNFDRPYFAGSISEFWNRWHISLSTWFRDYLFIPLGGSRAGFPRLIFNILVVFMVSGLWHGANWTFLVWGALHGVYYIVGRWTQKPRKALAQATGLSKLPLMYGAMRTLTTFALVCFAWIFFRADSLTGAVTLIARLGTGWEGALNPTELHDQVVELSQACGISQNEFLLSLGLIGLLLIIQLLHGSARASQLTAGRSLVIRWSVYLLVTLAILNLGVVREIPFIYFQF